MPILLIIMLPIPMWQRFAMICKEVLVWGLAATRFNLRNDSHDKNNNSKTKWRTNSRLPPPPRAEEKLAPKKLVRRRQVAKDPDLPRQQLAAPRRSEAVGAGNDVARRKEGQEEELPTKEEQAIEEQQAAAAKVSGVPRLSHGSHRHPTRGKTRHCNMSEVPKLRFECYMCFLNAFFGNYLHC
jgi:hypothetical protein